VGQAYEKLGAFYLGKEVDAQTGERTEDLVLYDSRDLTTHGVIIGMTGSGKTGLGVALLEEAAMDRIPVLAVDPKGDLTNLLLTFPDLEAADLRPWINEDAARQRGQDPDAYAAGQAELWRKGLQDWDQDGERIRRLREHADFAIYTPGSEAGLPVSVLRSFDAPPPKLLEDADGYRERVQTAVTGLLGLLGLDADPVRSREHILLASILDDAWRQGRSLDLGAMILAIQQPPFTRLGVMELESVYPSKDRFALAMQLNALLASPGFQGWMTGEPLDIGAMLYTPEGKPRLTVFSIAHLGDAERMFFVTMLLSAVLGWMRGQSGTTSLRALVYMDEIFGFFPPNANPPSKKPMLTLLKQARAFGVGMVLATQNPVDLDYKGLGNTGTWFIGRLQTERDKMRVLEALDGAMAGSNPIPRQQLDRMLSGLGSRVFLMHNVHRGAPTLMTTRWVMSYLAGPLTLTQIRTLTGSRETPAAAAAPTFVGEGESGMPGLLGTRPILPTAIRQFFVPAFAAVDDLHYRPALLAAIDVRYSSARHGVEETRHLQPVVEFDAGPLAFSTDRAALMDLSIDLLDVEPLADAQFAPLPEEATNPRSYVNWGRELVRWIQGAQPITLYSSAAHKVVSLPGESERDFRMRLADLGHEARDRQADQLRKRYESRFRTLQERLRRAEQAVETRIAQSRQAKLSAGLTAAGAVLGAITGSKRGGAKGGLLGALLGAGATRATGAARSAGRAAQKRQDVAHAQETVEAVRQQIEALEADLGEELDRLQETADSEEVLEEIHVRPAINAMTVRLVALVWLPYGRSGASAPVPLWRQHDTVAG
jgi:hypothetical protein